MVEGKATSSMEANVKRTRLCGVESQLSRCKMLEKLGIMIEERRVLAAGMAKLDSEIDEVISKLAFKEGNPNTSGNLQ